MDSRLLGNDRLRAEEKDIHTFLCRPKIKYAKERPPDNSGLRLPSLHRYLWRVYKLALLRQYKPFDPQITTPLGYIVWDLKIRKIFFFLCALASLREIKKWIPCSPQEYLSLRSGAQGMTGLAQRRGERSSKSNPSLAHNKYE